MFFLSFTFFHKMIHGLMYYKTLLVSEIVFTVSGIKAVDPRPLPNCQGLY